jgi:hypothetical protein
VAGGLRVDRGDLGLGEWLGAVHDAVGVKFILRRGMEIRLANLISGAADAIGTTVIIARRWAKQPISDPLCSSTLQEPAWPEYMTRSSS